MQYIGRFSNLHYCTFNLRNNLSQPASLSCGVPQGSILEPFLFLIHVNDISQAVKCDLFLYDDIHLFFVNINILIKLKII